MGEGLIGSALSDFFSKILYYKKESNLKIKWNKSEYSTSLKLMEEMMDSSFSQRTHQNSLTTGQNHLSIVWCAGRAGFSAEVNETELEYEYFEIFFDLINKIIQQKSFFDKIDFHFMSSAGGLFEGQTSIHEYSLPQPLRPYGQLKLKQEQLFTQFINSFSTSFNNVINGNIFRLSTVYGRIQKGQRIGLISNMIQNGVLKKVTPITGDLYTLRDYIHANDVAQMITHSMFQHKQEMDSVTNKTKFYFGISQKPTSIFEIKSIIEFYLKHKVYVQLNFAPANNKDIIFSKMEAPFGFYPRDMKTGIRDVINHWYGVSI